MRIYDKYSMREFMNIVEQSSPNYTQKIDDHLKNYYHHIILASAARKLGLPDKDAEHIGIASDHHGEALAFSKEMNATNQPHDFSQAKRKARANAALEFIDS